MRWGISCPRFVPAIAYSPALDAGWTLRNTLPHHRRSEVMLLIRNVRGHCFKFLASESHNTTNMLLSKHFQIFLKKRFLCLYLHFKSMTQLKTQYNSWKLLKKIKIIYSNNIWKILDTIPFLPPLGTSISTTWPLPLPQVVFPYLTHPIVVQSLKSSCPYHVIFKIPNTQKHHIHAWVNPLSMWTHKVNMPLVEPFVTLNSSTKFYHSDLAYSGWDPQVNSFSVQINFFLSNEGS